MHWKASSALDNLLKELAPDRCTKNTLDKILISTGDKWQSEFLRSFASKKLQLRQKCKYLVGLIQHEVHVLVEPGDDPLDPGVDILVQPHLDNGAVLQNTG